MKGGGDNFKATIPLTVKNVLKKMGWLEYSWDEGHSRSDAQLIFGKRPKVADLHQLFKNSTTTDPMTTFYQ